MANMFNAKIRGWYQYYARFYPSKMSGIWHHLDWYLVQWIRRKFKRFSKHKRRARIHLAYLKQQNSGLFYHWRLVQANKWDEWWEPYELRGSRTVLEGTEAGIPRSTQPYLWASDGWLYFAVVIDLYSCAVVGWSMKKRMKASLVTAALTMAMFRRGMPKGVIIHSNRGS